MNKSGVQKRNKRAENFSSKEKRKLAVEVKARPEIWNLLNPQHSHKNAVERAWRSIGANLDKPANECKAAWISLRESYRYHERRAVKNKSEESGAEIKESKSFPEIDWEYAEEMSFLPSVFQKKKTFTSDCSEQSDVNMPAENDENSTFLFGEAEASQSSDDYNDVAETNSPSCSTQTKKRASEELASTLKKLLSNQNVKEKDSKFKDSLNSFETVLKRLPEEDAFEACDNIHIYLAELLKHHKSKTDTAADTDW